MNWAQIDLVLLDLDGTLLDLPGTLDWYCVNFWYRELDLNILALKTEPRHLIKLRPGTKSFLSYLRTQRQRVILATNAHVKSVELKFQQTGLAPLFDRIITSRELGHPKEDKIFWEKLHLLEAFDPKHTLFIEDNLTVLQATACYSIGHLFAVSQPNLTQSIQTPPTNFASLDHFDDLLLSDCPRTVL